MTNALKTERVQVHADAMPIFTALLTAAHGDIRVAADKYMRLFQGDSWRDEDEGAKWSVKLTSSGRVEITFHRDGDGNPENSNGSSFHEMRTR